MPSHQGKRNFLFADKDALLQSVGSAVQPLAEMLGNAVAGVAAGVVVLAAVSAGQWLWRRLRAAQPA